MENKNVNPEIVEKEETQIATVETKAPANIFSDDGFSLVADLSAPVNQYCSMDVKTEADQMNLFNAMNNPDARIADMINMVIAVKDVFVEVVNCTNTETGEVTACPRIVLIDDKGKSYQAVSIGIYSAIKKAFMSFGVPTWEKPVKFKVTQITKGDRKMLTLTAII